MVARGVPNQAVYSSSVHAQNHCYRAHVTQPVELISEQTSVM